MSKLAHEQITDPNQVLSDFLMSLSQHVVNDRRVGTAEQSSDWYRETEDILINAHDVEFSQGEDQWPEDLLLRVARCAVKGRRAEVEAKELRQPSFLYDRGLQILDQIPNWAGIIIVAASISGDKIIQRSSYKPWHNYKYYINEGAQATAQGILRSDSILDTDNTTLLLRTTENVFRRRRYSVPLLDPITLEPQVTLRVAES